MSKRKPTNLPEVEIAPDILKILQRDYNIGLYEDIIDLSASDTTFNYDDNVNDSFEIIVPRSNINGGSNKNLFYKKMVTELLLKQEQVLQDYL